MVFSDWFRFKISCTESWYVVITDDSSRDLVNELIHHSFISEVRLKNTLIHTTYCKFPIFTMFIISKHIRIISCMWHEITWKQQLELNVHFLFNFLSYAHILPSIFWHQFPQEDGDKIVAFLEEALNRHRGSASVITTIWMTMVCCNGHLHASGTWEGGPPTEEGQWKQMIQFVS